ncbi:MAG: potassium transporter Kup [Acidimicrobiales bacterium]|nr:potassium transporter Kup [Acidimicrobiales bacterium]
MSGTDAPDEPPGDHPEPVDQVVPPLDDVVEAVDGHGTKAKVGLAALTLGALGVVFGDIGTSPLYAFRETFEGHSIPVDEANVIGVCSLILWSLILVVSIKYIVFVLRADNHGEGGILALTTRVVGDGRRSGSAALLLFGLFGVALLYGDGLITPAISVLSATEGVGVAAPALQSWVVPLAVAILLALFAIQRRGTGAIGALFGPVMVVWFSTLAILGVTRIGGNLDVLQALSPTHAVSYLVSNGFDGFLSLGSVFLVVTGGEALYADLGHFGMAPIRRAWFAVAFPGLVLNYFGQGALLLENPEAIESPFFLMGPSWASWPLVGLATMATVIASQALITGAFSLTVQAVQLDYLPRLTLRHTSSEHRGQVYLPLINWILAVGCIGLVLAFQSSSGLAAAYGIAVTATMGLTTYLFFVFVQREWGWSRTRALVLCIPLAAMDLGFFGANIFKIPAGGWFPLLIAALLMGAMTTWRTGRRLVADRLAKSRMPIVDFTAGIDEEIARVEGIAAYMYRGHAVAPASLVSNVRHNRVLHEQVLLLQVAVAGEATVDPAERAQIEYLGRGIYELQLTFGYMEEPDVPGALAELELDGELLDTEDITYFLGREIVIPTHLVGMALWRERLFAFMLRSAASAARFFNLPPDQVVEIGSQVRI